MRNLTIALTAAIVAGFGFASAANADTSAYNRYTTTNQYNGHSETTVDARTVSNSKEITISNTTKVEAIADLGDVNVTNVRYEGGEFSADAHSRNGRPVDPVSTIYVTEVSQKNVTTTRDIADINTFNSYDFDGTTYEHEVGNRF